MNIYFKNIVIYISLLVISGCANKSQSSDISGWIAGLSSDLKISEIENKNEDIQYILYQGMIDKISALHMMSIDFDSVRSPHLEIICKISKQYIEKNLIEYSNNDQLLSMALAFIKDTRHYLEKVKTPSESRFDTITCKKKPLGKQDIFR